MRRASEGLLPRVRPTLASDWAAYREMEGATGVLSHGNPTTDPVTSEKPAGARVSLCCSAIVLSVRAGM